MSIAIGVPHCENERLRSVVRRAGRTVSRRAILELLDLAVACDSHGRDPFHELARVGALLEALDEQRRYARVKSMLEQGVQREPQRLHTAFLAPELTSLREDLVRRRHRRALWRRSRRRSLPGVFPIAVCEGRSEQLFCQDGVLVGHVHHGFGEPLVAVVLDARLARAIRIELSLELLDLFAGVVEVSLERIAAGDDCIQVVAIAHRGRG